MAVLEIIDRAATTAVRAAKAHDQRVAAEQASAPASGAQAAARAPAEPDWANMPPVNGCAVMDEAVTFLRRFWVAPTEATYWLLAAWAAHCWVREPDLELSFYSTPRLAFVSDEPGSGKTAGMELTGLLCPRFELVTDPTAPALLEMIAQRRCTFGIDEVDLLFGNGMGAKAVRNVINSGYRKGASIPRVKGPQDCFAPMMLAGLASSYMGNATLGPTRSRSVIVHCRKPPPGVKPMRYREQLHGGIGRLAGEALGAWAAQNNADIVTAWPDMPGHLDGRQEDVWGPMFALCEIVGGPWPERIETACLEFTQGLRADAPVVPPQMRLTADIALVWPAGQDTITAAALGRALAGIPGAPWGSLWSPAAMAREIPAMLGVQPVKVNDGGRDVQGYRRADFAPLWDDDTEGR